MTTLAGRTIAALRSEHDTLAALVPALTADQLTGPSGASEWTVADVLSHMGSGAEIQLAALRAVLGEADAPGDGFNQSVWDRWNALSPQDQATGMLESDEALVSALEAIPAERHDELKVKTFMPEPVPLETFIGLRLSETAPHSWDVRAGIDPAAELLSAALLAEHLTGGIGFLLGFIGKPAGVDAVISVADTPYRIVIDNSVRLTTESPATTASFDGPLEAAIRLLYGRLKPAFTPAGVSVSGNVSLDQLRAAFPGF
ncbi:maleylpyruvate isomerase N-terminal domain-containing protein [Actinoplanes bogorensis]|uniref:Maleylpyruvate isomerase N-terminal domain-containing protein n=1 Tax=Paractinoplanes bogorensis TaxID=1610840 RepID=A0ABS5YJY1_9ACTN|nr:maleylpyruvate isomerase family mycothiol-dependent enzyme [Actinoplanes bogorensis]MBU2663790.1 maleylpyruvate isomerase N-terminal domain-containing protein [Actinoplanes bogorensis]